MDSTRERDRDEARLALSNPSCQSIPFLGFMLLLKFLDSICYGLFTLLSTITTGDAWVAMLQIARSISEGFYFLELGA